MGDNQVLRAAHLGGGEESAMSALLSAQPASLHARPPRARTLRGSIPPLMSRSICSLPCPLLPSCQAHPPLLSPPSSLPPPPPLTMSCPLHTPLTMACPLHTPSPCQAHRSPHPGCAQTAAEERGGGREEKRRGFGGGGGSVSQGERRVRREGWRGSEKGGDGTEQNNADI